MALERGGNRYFVVGEGERVCLLAVIKQDHGATCGTKAGINDAGLIITSPDEAASTLLVVGVVADGIDAATVGEESTRVENNVFVIPAAPLGPYLELSGRHESIRVPLGGQLPG